MLCVLLLKPYGAPRPCRDKRLTKFHRAVFRNLRAGARSSRDLTGRLFSPGASS